MKLKDFTVLFSKVEVNTNSTASVAKYRGLILLIFFLYRIRKNDFTTQSYL